MANLGRESQRLSVKKDKVHTGREREKNRGTEMLRGTEAEGQIC